MTTTLTTLILTAALTAPAAITVTHGVDAEIRDQGRRALAEMQTELRDAMRPQSRSADGALALRHAVPLHVGTPAPIATVDTSI